MEGPFTVHEDFDGYWFVANRDGEKEQGGFTREEDAYDWIDMIEQLS